MTQTLTPGRWRGLKTTSTDQNVFAILAFDQRDSYRKMLPADTPYEAAVQIKREVVTALSQITSAVLLDPTYGLEPALHVAGRCGLLMALEESGYTGDSTYRRMAFDADWTVGKIRRMGASAVKLLVYYHPEAGALTEEIEALIADICATCHAYDLPLFVEPVSYSLDAGTPKASVAFAETRPGVVRETARRLSRLGMDVLKMEFPVDAAFDDDANRWAAACAAVSEASAVPWVLLSAGVDFATFERQARAACKAGASGFLAGRAIWKEIVPLAPDERQRFLTEVAIPRTETLCAIAGSLARPWTDFYASPPASEDWFRSYAGITAP
ncbi:MAG: tagatose 1,6-diphosphate aldolase [Anaerolineae bacterium]|nr:tagatose 1,6-diphosphate aldolase [Anaerolineae bacterium]